MTPRAVTLLLAVLLLGSPATTAGPDDGGGAPPGVTCAGFAHLDGVGPACPVSRGLWEVFAPDGSSLGYTHGADPAPSEPRSDEPGFGGTAAVQPPACVDDPTRDHHNVVIYARAQDDDDRYADVAQDIRHEVVRANTHLRVEAGAHNVQADYLMRCSGGSVQIVKAVLSTAQDRASFSTIVSDLKRLGHDDNHVKYWVWYDDTGACTCAGVGSLYPDDRLVADNYNNGHPWAQPMYAVTFGYLDFTVMMHENAHNMGAVQVSAPHTSGAYHCIDGSDIMCYNDGGSHANQYSTSACTGRIAFDCNHDDYFHADPAPGSYLATHWNLGSTLNRFLTFGDCGLAREATLLAAGASMVRWEGMMSRTETGIDATCGGRTFVLTSADPLADFDVCFYNGDVELACHLTDGDETGIVPVGTTRAEVLLFAGAWAQYTLITP